MIGVYEKSMPNSMSVKEKLAVAKAAGFDFMEISIDETDEKLSRLNNTNFVNEVKTAMAEADLPILTMCLSGHRKYPLGTESQAVVERSMQIMQGAIDFAVSVGIRIIQLAGYDEYYNESNETTRKNFELRLGESVRLAAKKGVILAFETMETPFMNTVEKSMKYVSMINNPYLQVYPDLGNVTNGAVDAIEDMKTGEGHIVAAHLKETKEGVFRDMFFGEGRVDFKGCLTELKRQGVELFNCEFWYDGISEPLEYLKKARTFFKELGI